MLLATTVAVPPSFSATAPDVAWDLTIGGNDDDRGYWVEVTSDSNLIVCGSTTSFGAGNKDVYVAKVDMLGDTLWTRTYGDTGGDCGLSIVEMGSGGYLIGGFSSSFGTGDLDAYLSVTNALGDTIWMRTFGGSEDDIFYCARETSRGQIIACGHTYSNPPYDSADVYVVMTTPNGTLKWKRTYGAWSDDRGMEIIETTDGGFAIAGYSRYVPLADVAQVYVLRLDSGGDTLWTRRYGGAGSDYGSAIRQTPDGGFLIGGSTTSMGAGNYDMYLIRTDANGDTLWTRTYGGVGDEFCSDICPTADTGYLLVGRTSSSGAGLYDLYIVKITSGGDVVWETTIGGVNDDMAFCGRETPDHGYIVAGLTESTGAGLEDMYLVKLETDVSGLVPHSRGDLAELKPVGSNPFNTHVDFAVSLTGRQRLSLSIYDVHGREVVKLIDGGLVGESQIVRWNGCDAAGQMLPSGLYFARLVSGSHSVSTKIVLLR